MDQVKSMLIQFLKRIRFLITLIFGIPAYKIYMRFLNLKNQNYTVLNTKKTLHLIIQNKLSVCRFGDGEFQWILMNRSSNNFEQNSVALSKALNEVLKSQNKQVAVCIPDVFDGLADLNVSAKTFWARIVFSNRRQWKSLLQVNRTYLNSLFTRPYMDLEDKSQAQGTFDLVKKIWDARDVILVEGENTKFGVGNDLLDNAKHTYRIIAPSENAFEKYDLILKKVIETIETTPFENPIILVALGPTATVLCNDLSGYCQSIDIGHLDVEYSWYLMHADKKVKIDYKYVNEVRGGDKVSEIDNKEMNDKYINQIKTRI